MRIDEETCVGCGACVPYCPMAAITNNDFSEIDQEECVDCGCCIRAAVCPVDALIEEAHPWPRSVRATFSNPLIEHKETRIPGRGTEEMKTNDVTGRYGRGVVGIAAELGRPSVGTRFRDVEKVAMAMRRGGLKFAEENPVTRLMKDPLTGEMDPDIYDEKVLSAIIEGTVELKKISNVISELTEVASDIDTVFSLDLIARVEPDGSVPAEGVLDDLGIPFYINGKNNLGLGRPLGKEES